MFSQKTTGSETENIEDLSKIPGKTSWHICMYIYHFTDSSICLFLESGMFVLKKEDDQQAFLVCSQLIEPLLQK